MKTSDVIFTGFSISVGCSLLFLGYVYFASQKVSLQRMAGNSQSLRSNFEEQQKKHTDDVTNINETIRSVENNTEYTNHTLLFKVEPIVEYTKHNISLDVEPIAEKTKHNLSFKAEPIANGTEIPLFIDTMKASRLTKDSRLLDATTPHDLSGYVSVLHHKQSLELHCRKCVIVWSSSHILNSTAGTAIEADRSCIFRMNVAPTILFENDVGARTTVRVLSHESIRSLFQTQKDMLGHPNSTKILLAWGPPTCMKPGGSCEKRLKKLAGDYPKVEFYVTTKDEISYADQLFEEETGRSRSKSGTWLSTGWFTMVLARSVCGEIHVYGMVDENYCRHEHGRTVPYHYYDPHSQDECVLYRGNEKSTHGGHRFMAEKAIFASWAKLTPKIYFHHPEWE